MSESSRDESRRRSSKKQTGAANGPDDTNAGFSKKEDQLDTKHASNQIRYKF